MKSKPTLTPNQQATRDAFVADFIKLLEKYDGTGTRCDVEAEVDFYGNNARVVANVYSIYDDAGQDIREFVEIDLTDVRTDPTTLKTT